MTGIDATEHRFPLLDHNLPPASLVPDPSTLFEDQQLQDTMSHVVDWQGNHTPGCMPYPFLEDGIHQPPGLPSVPFFDINCELPTQPYTNSFEPSHWLNNPAAPLGDLFLGTGPYGHWADLDTTSTFVSGAGMGFSTDNTAFPQDGYLLTADAQHMDMDWAWDATAQGGSDGNQAIGDPLLDQWDSESMMYSLEPSQSALMIPNADPWLYFERNGGQDQHMLDAVQPSAAFSQTPHDGGTDVQVQPTVSVGGLDTAMHADQPTVVHTSPPEPTKVVGLSRPVDLPPARKGGRRGRLSAWEKSAIKLARQAGICIRCRRHKKKARNPDHSLLAHSNHEIV